MPRADAAEQVGARRHHRIARAGTIMALNESAVARAVFLDNDGTLVREVPCSVDPAQIELSPRAGPSLRALQDAGYRLIVVSNPPGVAPGRFSPNALCAVEARLDDLLVPYGVVITAYCWCPHHACARGGTRACACRKPRPGLLLGAASVHEVALEQSWMIGDTLDDVEAGARAGCRTILVDRGGERRWRGGRMRTPNAIVYDFADAASIILGGPRRARTAHTAAASP
jgi:histidinol-phosphate phosphatase family protein